MQATRTIRSYAPVIGRTGKLLGWVVRLSDGSSYFEQRKHVAAGVCANYGPTWTR